MEPGREAGKVMVDPARAWPAAQRAVLPGPIPYWGLLSLPVVALGLTGTIGLRAFARKHGAAAYYGQKK